MIGTDILEQKSGQPSEMPLQRQWAQLGRELFTLEGALTDSFVTNETPRVEQEEMERKRESGTGYLLSFIAMKKNFHAMRDTALFY